LRLYYTISENAAALKLLDYALEQEFNIKKRPEILRGEHGKPYFADCDIKFNYSHCKYGVACAVSDCEIGVDIQEIRKIKPSVIQRVCCDNELEIIKNDEDFIRIWTLKEAYSKYTGKGFAERFKSIDTTKFSPECVFKVGAGVSLPSLYIACYATGVTPQLVQVELP